MTYNSTPKKVIWEIKGFGTALLKRLSTTFAPQ